MAALTGSDYVRHKIESFIRLGLVQNHLIVLNTSVTELNSLLELFSRMNRAIIVVTTKIIIPYEAQNLSIVRNGTD
jgi:hypothetical protein